jgi:hypothetical protein
MMNDFFEELSEEEISVRDRHQFEFKVDYMPDALHKKNEFNLDFYFFIPGALQINPRTYTKEQFFQDLTTLIRFKTPDLSFQDILDATNNKSPLTRIHELCAQNLHHVKNDLEHELKLLANIVRSRLREEIKGNIEKLHLKDAAQIASAAQAVEVLCDQFLQIQQQLDTHLQAIIARSPDTTLINYWSYVDEFLVTTSVDFISGFLYEMRNTGVKKSSLQVHEKAICNFIKNQRAYCMAHNYPVLTPESNEVNGNEFFIYRKGVLRKFVLDVLLLQTERKESSQQYKHINHMVAAFAAGVAMLVYLLILVANTDSLLINSTPFILGTVLLYMLKDRLKEELRGISTRIFKWFPDYTTSIKSRDEKQPIGKLMETFQFIQEDQVPKEILEIRNKEFHQALVEAKRIETIFKYSKQVILNEQFFDEAGRDYGLNDIFRFNIANFLYKASESHIDQLYLDPDTDSLSTLSLHKVYHINVIIQEMHVDKTGTTQTQLRKVRLVLDKDGIVRMEMIF